MAYLARIEATESQAAAHPSRIVGTAAKPDFTLLEWSIIRLARVDALSTLHPPGRVARFFNWLTGRNGNPELANPRLEALRRISVLSWHFGFSVPGEAVAAFLAAGFTPGQYELLVRSIRLAAVSPTQRVFPEVPA